MTHAHAVVAKSTKTVVEKMRKALFYKDFAKIQKIEKVTKS